jgi:D-glycero-D-manno-heptose 1,7-bisphosphate phosphatase
MNVDVGHAHRIDQIQFVPGIFELVREATVRGYVIIIVTNQAGIAKGFYSESQFETLSKWMVEQFSSSGGSIAKVTYCPHHEQASVAKFKLKCRCRKPQPGLLLDAISDFDIDALNSIMVGDNWSDMQAGFSAEVTALYLLKNESEPNDAYKHLIPLVHRIDSLLDVRL